MRTLTLGQDELTIERLVHAARDPAVRIEVDPEALRMVAERRLLVDRTIEDYGEAWRAWKAGERAEPPPMDYGLTTGFGEFKRVAIDPAELHQLSANILKSHAVGVGSAAPHADDLSHYFPPEVVRAVLILRAATFLRGHSGVRAELVLALRDMLNAGVIPLVPLKGSLGASGDLCPLCHLFCPLVGEGRFYRVTAADPRPVRPELLPVRDGDVPVFARAVGLDPQVLFPRPKEGLALSNGSTFSLATLAFAVYGARIAVETADVAAALSLEAMAGCARALDPRIHEVRGQLGQIQSAAHILRLVHGSRAVDACGDVQDPYSIRCAPVVHGASRDAIAYVEGIVSRELLAATDNPLFFPEGPEPVDVREFSRNWRDGYNGAARAAYSAGNFHGQPIALAADFLGIALAEIASISERRVQLLLDAHHNRGLPANLAPHGGVNSGLMIAQYTAAGLVSENKVLAHPASVDSIPSSANIEDHVSMSTVAARKAIDILHHVHTVLAIELLCGAQAVEWRIPGTQDGGRPTLRFVRPALEDPAAREFADAAAFAAAITPAATEARAGWLGRGTGKAYRAVRGLVRPVTHDRFLAADVAALLPAVREGDVLRAAAD